MSVQLQPSASPMSAAPYTREEIAAFEKFNAITMPEELVTHLTTVSRVLQRPEGRATVIEIYEGDPHSENEDKATHFMHRSGSFTAVLPHDHPLIRDGLVAAGIDDFKYGTIPEPRLFELQTKRAAERIAVKPPPFLRLCEKDPFGAKTLCIAVHGCGEDDWMSMETGRIYMRDWDRNSYRWFSEEVGSLSEYMALPPGTHPAKK